MNWSFPWKLHMGLEKGEIMKLKRPKEIQKSIGDIPNVCSKNFLSNLKNMESVTTLIYSVKKL